MVVIRNRLLEVSPGKYIQLSRIKSIEYVSSSRCKVVISKKEEYTLNVNYHELMDGIARARHGESEVIITHEVTQQEIQQQRTNTKVGLVIAAIVVIFLFVVLPIVV